MKQFPILEDFSNWYNQCLIDIWAYRLEKGITNEWYELCAEIRDFLSCVKQNITPDEIEEKERLLCTKYWLYEQYEYYEYENSYTESN